MRWLFLQPLTRQPFLEHVFDIICDIEQMFEPPGFSLFHCYEGPVGKPENRGFRFSIVTKGTRINLTFVKCCSHGEMVLSRMMDGGVFCLDDTERSMYTKSTETGKQ